MGPVIKEAVWFHGFLTHGPHRMTLDQAPIGGNQWMCLCVGESDMFMLLVCEHANGKICLLLYMREREKGKDQSSCEYVLRH